jgi:hypothetical protein
MKNMVFSLMFFLVGCASLTTLKPARVLNSGEMSGTVGISTVEKDGPMMDGAGRVGLGKGIEVGIKSDYSNFSSVDMRAQLLKLPLYCNFGFGIGFSMNGNSQFSNFSREFIYQPSLEFGQDWWYYSFSVFHPTTTRTFHFLSREFIYVGGEFSAWNMALGGKLDVTKTSSFILELNYVNFKSGGAIWVPAIGIHVSD